MNDVIRKILSWCLLILKTVGIYCALFFLSIVVIAFLPNVYTIQPDGTQMVKMGYVVFSFFFPLVISIFFFVWQKKKLKQKIGSFSSIFPKTPKPKRQPKKRPEKKLEKKPGPPCPMEEKVVLPAEEPPKEPTVPEEPVIEKTVAKKKQKLPIDHFVVLDIETTGLSRKDDRIIEIAANKYSDDVLIEEYHTYVNPEIHIPATITRLTGISDANVADAPSIQEAKEGFLAFIGNYPLVGHNIATFDIPFIQTQMDVTLGNTVHDTLKISRQVFPGLPSYKLSYLDQVLRLGGKEHHRASNDVIVNHALFLACNNPKPYKRILKDKKTLECIEIEPRRMLFENVDVHSIIPSCDAVCQTGLTGKCVAFTGEIVMSRREAMQKAVDAGATLKSHVSNKVDYLVVGDQDKRLVGATGMSSDQRYAAELIAKGNERLKVIGEAEFMELLKPVDTTPVL